MDFFFFRLLFYRFTPSSRGLGHTNLLLQREWMQRRPVDNAGIAASADDENAVDRRSRGFNCQSSVCVDAKLVLRT
jgi:hypothetical protein